MATQSNKSIIIWLLSGCLLIYTMVVIGGITRLTRSGLSMVEWSPTGALPPMNDAEWNIQFEKYKQSPEYKQINNYFSLDDFKNIFWWEYIHRFIGRTIGIVFIIPFLWFLIRKKFPSGFLKKALVLLSLGALQGLLGWYMVKSGLVNDPHVSHFRLAAHLMTAFTTFGFTFWYALDLIYPNRDLINPPLKRMAIWVLIVAAFQMMYGAFVAGLKAGFAYPTFPKMGDNWIPDELITLAPVWKNFTEGIAGVQFVHRYVAYIVVILVLILFFKAKKMQLSGLQNKLVNALLIIVSIQFLLGVLTLVLIMPISLAALHQTGAFFLFSTLLFLIHQSR